MENKNITHIPYTKRNESNNIPNWVNMNKLVRTVKLSYLINYNFILFYI